MAKRDSTERARNVQRLYTEVRKMADGLEDGRLEAFEMLGMTLVGLIENPGKTDMYMALIFELLPAKAQAKMLADGRLSQSVTIPPPSRPKEEGRRPQQRDAVSRCQEMTMVRRDLKSSDARPNVRTACAA